MRLLIDFIKQTYIYIIVLGGLLIALNSMFLADKKSKRKINTTLFILSAVVFVDFLTGILEDNKDLMWIYKVFDLISQGLKPVIVIVLIRLFTDRFNRIFIAIVSVNTITCIIAIFFNGFVSERVVKAYSILPIVCRIVLLIVLMVEGIKYISKTNFREAKLLIYILVNIVVTISIDIITTNARLLNPIYAINIMFYLLYIHNENSKKDPLTKAFNRQSFYSDVESIGYAINGVILFDVNDFKKINDVYGHTKGDEVLVAIVESVSKYLTHGSRLYRTGGDEFLIISRKNKDTIISISDKIRSECQKMGYPCAVGVCLRKKNILSIDDMVKEADENMYRDKSIQKQKAKDQKKSNSLK